MQEDETEPAEVQEVVDVVTTAKLIIEVVTASSETIIAVSAIILTVEPQVPAATPIAASARVAAAPSRRRKGVTPAEKAAKRRKLNEEVEDLKRHLEIMPDEDDDVYTEATPLAKKVPVVDYEIIEINNKPYYKIIRADETHQLYISFLTLLKNFDREDLEALWNLVKERCTCSSLKESKDYTWSRKGQELEDTRIMWCAYHNLYNHTADFVSKKKVPTLKVYSRPDAKCCKTLGRRGNETITAASTTITAAEAQVPIVTLTAALARVTAAPSRRRKGVVIRDPEESTTTTSIIIPAETKSKDKDEKYARELEAELNKNIDYDEAIDHVNKKVKEDNAVKRCQAMKRKPHTEAQARKNMMVYLKNVAEQQNTLLRNFDREELEALWSLVKEIFATTKPKNFSDDFLLITLGAMFEKPDIHAQI
nr:hypothetical protein [Tanacetum cinerariifolium]